MAGDLDLYEVVAVVCEASGALGQTESIHSSEVRKQEAMALRRWLDVPG